jgi:2-methylaconitate cis-trans-isomerase PrpF
MTIFINPEQLSYPCTLMRGGTSKALFFHEKDIPSPGKKRDDMLLRAMGSPDVLQIDGMGGSRLITSKVAILQASKRDYADVDFTFVQVDVERNKVYNDANCGNISAAVGPFAIDEGLVELCEPITTVRIYNSNTGKILKAEVPVHRGKAKVCGDCVIPGVPGTGAKILMDYSDTIGAMTGRLLPTDNVIDTIRLENGLTLEVSLCDVGNPCIFVNSKDLGLSGIELAPQISADNALREIAGEISAKAGQMIGLWPDWKTECNRGFPLLVLISPPAKYIDMKHNHLTEEVMDIHARMIFLGECHESMAVTAAMCTTAASQIPGSLVNKILKQNVLKRNYFHIAHSLGVMSIDVSSVSNANPNEISFSTLGLARTARRLMDGHIYLPNPDASKY